VQSVISQRGKPDEYGGPGTWATADGTKLTICHIWFAGFLANLKSDISRNPLMLRSQEGTHEFHTENRF